MEVYARKIKPVTLLWSFGANKSVSFTLQLNLQNVSSDCSWLTCFPKQGLAFQKSRAQKSMCVSCTCCCSPSWTSSDATITSCLWKDLPSLGSINKTSVVMFIVFFQWQDANSKNVDNFQSLRWNFTIWRNKEHWGTPVLALSPPTS